MNPFIINQLFETTNYNKTISVIINSNVTNWYQWFTLIQSG